MSIGNLQQKKLTPDKLATFYKAVGGNYDCLCLFLFCDFEFES